jgi:hypothetical protein
MLDALRALRLLLEGERSREGRFIPADSAVTAEGMPDVVAYSMHQLDFNPTRPVSGPEASGLPWQRIEALIPKTSPLHGMTSLEQVAEYVAATELIPLDAMRTRPVFASGTHARRLS